MGVGGTIQRSRSLASWDTPISVFLSVFLSFFFLVVVVVGLFGCLVGCLAIVCLFVCLLLLLLFCLFLCFCFLSLQKRDQLLTLTKDHLGHVRVRWVTEASEYQHAVKVSVFNMLMLHGHYRLLKKKKKKQEEEEEKKSQ